MEWWKKEKAAKIERNKDAERSASGVNIGDTFLIVTEGEVSEPYYFERIKKLFGLNLVDVKIQSGVDSHPNVVLQTAIDLIADLESRWKKKKLSVTEVETYDHVWIVIDADVLDCQSQWDEFIQRADKHGVKVAYTAPCIEYWFYLHLEYTTSAQFHGGNDAGKNAKKLFKDKLGLPYDTSAEVSKTAIESFYKDWKTAVKHAKQCRQHHEGAGTPTPAFPSSTVDQLVEALNLSARESKR